MDGWAASNAGQGSKLLTLTNGIRTKGYNPRNNRRMFGLPAANITIQDQLGLYQ